MTNPELVQRIVDMTPLRRLAEPRDVADAIVFLASDRASMITGHTQRELLPQSVHAMHQ